MIEFMTKPANQNIDVRYTQTRNPYEWYATITLAERKYKIGPADIGAIMVNVANFIRTEAAYSDLKVHGEKSS